MKTYISDVTLLRQRIGRFISRAESILNLRKEFLWSSFMITNGKCKRVSAAVAKKRFRAQFVDRFSVVLECLKGDDFSAINWVDFRDVLISCGYKANFFFKTEEELKAWDEDIVIEIYSTEDISFRNTLDRLAMGL
jgi:hypothetical protein